MVSFDFMVHIYLCLVSIPKTLSSLCCFISLRLAPYLEPSSTMVALEWMDVEPLIGCKVSDYIIQHKRVDDPSEAEVYTGRKTKSKAEQWNINLDYKLCILHVP